MQYTKNSHVADCVQNGGAVLTRRIYADVAQTSGQERDSGVSGCWYEPDKLSAHALLQQIEKAELCAQTMVLKKDRRTCVMRAKLLGRDVIIKRYELTKWSEKLKYLVRMAPARRFWAASVTMRRLGIATPEPYGFVELHTGGIPLRSYVVNEFVSDSVMARQWIEGDYLGLSGRERNAFSDQLLESLLELYSHGIYHKDTKCENILLVNPADPAQRKLIWIDLECVLCRTPGRHDIIRNLVQINGSLGLNVSRDDRQRFLNRLAEAGYPWAHDRSTVEKIVAWTARRLEKEKWET